MFKTPSMAIMDSYPNVTLIGS